ncbi:MULTISPECIES: ABC transporter permease [Micromonospora]|uniref:Peptide/nickel transport system permease protein n=1 Tax=Micromonospora yangpuensis TaxID=683228 RepID=A0A1C6UXS5_9ACTN|nr:ABC transporter permease [Micromonospora yangpuensis]GGL94759.1 peptide ABC transporter permease [Micromonospora yangpuensis]SCL58809.1 peptide/nickel transport system permease protein [Micromonospora yangpuensis]
MSAPVLTEQTVPPTEPQVGATRAAWRNWLRQPSALLSMLVLAVMVLLAVFAPLIADEPSGTSAEVLQPPSGGHWFGTDDLGQDIFAQVVWGTRTSLVIGVAASLIALLLGTAIGLASAYVRGVDAVGTVVTDVMLALPTLPLMIMLAAVVSPSVVTLTIIIGVFAWPEVARLIRSQGLVVTAMPYIDGARVLGASGWRIVTREILPAVIPLMVVSVLLTASRAVISEAGLSFLGLGDPDAWSWGRILLNAQRSGVVAIAWWQTLFPSLAILFLVLSATVAGMRFNDTRDPRRNGG